MRFKIVAIICGILIISLAFYFSTKNLSKTIEGPSLETNNGLVIDNSSSKLSLASPFQVDTQPKQDLVNTPLNSEVDKNLEKQNDINNILEQDIKNKLNSNPINNYVSGSTSSTVNLPTTLQNNIIEKYYGDFLKTTSQIGFGNDLIKKSSDGIPFALEELIDLAKSGTSPGELKDSFLAWYGLDQKVLDAMQNMKVDPKAMTIHQELINWFSYHLEISKKFSDGNLTVSQINSLSLEFKQKATTHTLQFKQNINSPIALDNIFKKIVNFFAPHKAEAFTCAAFTGSYYHFGGRILFMFPCNLGIVYTISTPCGGNIFFTWVVMAINPYLWRIPYYSTPVLGRSYVSMDKCQLGVQPYATYYGYEAYVIYFGSALK